jgi:hypothetical protein
MTSFRNPMICSFESRFFRSSLLVGVLLSRRKVSPVVRRLARMLAKSIG